MASPRYHFGHDHDNDFLQGFLDADLIQLTRQRRLSAIESGDEPPLPPRSRPSGYDVPELSSARSSPDMQSLCERLADERDRAVAEAQEMAAARDTALAACAQLASMAPRKAGTHSEQLEEEILKLTDENKHLSALCGRMQAAGREMAAARTQAARDRSAALAALEDAEAVAARFQAQRDELAGELEHVRFSADAMLTDAAEHIRHLSERSRKLEKLVERLLAESHARSDAAQAELREATPRNEAFGMTRTRAAIETAVREAAALPEAERRKKLNALRLKWHPDKHEVLREMATEVTKMINEAVERCPSEAAAPAAAGSPAPAAAPAAA